MFLSFCDLDLTFIQTERHLESDEPRHVVYTSDSGSNICTTPKQISLFNEFNSGSSGVIPVTARSIESLKRVESTFNFNSFKVCNYGVFIYTYDNKLIPEFTDTLIGKVSSSQNELRESIKYLHLYNVHSKLITHKTYGFYIEGNINNKSTDLLKLNSILKQHKGLELYINGTGFSIFPKTLKPKTDAVRFIKKKMLELHPGVVTIGIGDSKSDLFFMLECDFLMTPTKDNVQIIKELLS
ncbi:haloacid dehalogenase [Acinetobacter phage vB_AbaM_ME3]|uniref:Haloacid dehalogenase n=1 Tax=Acinetobacter phage vB_AbaM_ME3 TaxID=1837876 RepID=A0A172Q0Q4_9CAUD|nr:haloacid dehalogenase [Acinetobacter phage vB_AbaM_ME3]AND75448.1 haloacid dehalogenase [Acinetobacter phage vB_AbaM_ME3]